MNERITQAAQSAANALVNRGPLSPAPVPAQQVGQAAERIRVAMRQDPRSALRPLVESLDGRVEEIVEQRRKLVDALVGGTPLDLVEEYHWRPAVASEAKLVWLRPLLEAASRLYREEITVEAAVAEADAVAAEVNAYSGSSPSTVMEILDYARKLRNVARLTGREV